VQNIGTTNRQEDGGYNNKVRARRLFPFFLLFFLRCCSLRFTTLFFYIYMNNGCLSARHGTMDIQCMFYIHAHIHTYVGSKITDIFYVVQQIEMHIAYTCNR
jgi:hypothetical protein